MPRKKVTVDELRAEMKRILDEYVEDVNTAIDLCAIQEAKIAKSLLSTESPKLTGDYAKGWAYKKFKNKFTSGAVVHNKTDWQLAHLLEHGHVIRNGTKRTYGAVQGYPHIGPVADRVNQEFYEEVVSKLGK